MQYQLLSRRALILLITFATFGSAMAQDNAQKADISQIRGQYYHLRQNLEAYEKVVLADSLIAYLEEDEIIRIEVTPPGRDSYDFYYQASGDLFFAYQEGAQGVANRYYFKTNGHVLLNAEITVMIRWLDANKQPVDSQSEAFEKRNYQVLSKGMTTYRTCKFLLENKGPTYGELQEWIQKVDHYQEVVSSAEVPLLEEIDLLAGDEEEFCTDVIRRFGNEKGKVIYENHLEECDPGCMVISTEQTEKYFNDSGEPMLFIETDKVTAYSTEKLLLNANTVVYSKKKLTYYKNGKPFCDKHSLEINDHVIY